MSIARARVLRMLRAGGGYAVVVARIDLTERCPYPPPPYPPRRQLVQVKCMLATTCYDKERLTAELKNLTSAFSTAQVRGEASKHPTLFMRWV